MADRRDIRIDYHPTTKGKRQQKVDVIILQRGQEALDEHVERVIVCQSQKPRAPEAAEPAGRGGGPA